MPGPPPLALTADLPADAMRLTCDVTLAIGDETIPAQLTAAILPAPFGDLLPAFRTLTNVLVASAAAREAAAGRAISCRAGCGACCRQAVPVSPSEARALAALVAALPVDRREAITARFAGARAALAAAGVAHDAAGLAAHTPAARDDFGRAYFGAGVACPFLEAEACSIHPDRPLACREYLVTSPAEHCAAPSDATIRGVPLAGRVSAAVRAQEAEVEGLGLIVLVDALDWAAAHPAPPPAASGLDLAMATLARLPASRPADGA